MEEFSDSNPGGSEGAKQSKYNSAVAQLYRMDDLFKDAHRHSRQILYASWNEDLDRIWVELAPDASPDQLKEVEELNEKIINSQVYSNLSMLKKKKPQLHAKLIYAQKAFLLKKERLLREMQNTQGKGTAYQDDLDDYLD